MSVDDEGEAPEQSRADDAIILDFLARYGDDRAEGRSFDQSHYQQRYPVHAALIAREYQRLQQDAQSPAPSESSGAAFSDLGPYKIVRRIGQGGQGVVYLAEDTRLSRQVALKVLTAFGGIPKDTVARFRREAETASRLDHPGICTIYEAGSAQGIPYIAMRYVEGVTLAEVFSGPTSTRPEISTEPKPPRSAKHRGPSTPSSKSLGRTIRETSTILSYIEKVARALHFAHVQGVVHRDVKPGNIIVTPHGQPVVLDFGLARDLEESGLNVTRTGDILGTPIYMSPEQIDRTRGRIDARTDVWALGVILFEGLSGQRPFRSATRAALYQSILNEEPPPLRHLVPGASKDLEIIVETALQKDPDRRYGSADALALDLARHLANQPILARPPSFAYRFMKFARRHRVALAAAALLLLVLISATIVSLAYAREAHQKAEDAEKSAQRVLEESDLVREINRFLNEDLLSAVSPEVQGHEVKMRTVLDAAAAGIEGRFKNRPRAGVTIQRTLGRTYRALCALEPAELHLKKALDRSRSELGVDDIESHRSAVEFGAYYLMLGKNQEAEVLFASAHPALQRLLGEGHAETLDAAHWLGVSFGEQGRFDDAERAFSQVRSRALESLGPEHPIAISCLHSLALNRLGASRAAKKPRDPTVLPYLEEALVLSRKVHGSDRGVTLRRMIDLSSCRYAGRDVQGAEVLLEEALQRSRTVQGLTHPTTLTALAGLAQIWMSNGEHDRAAATLSDVVGWGAETLPKSHPRTLVFRILLATCRLEQGHHAEAEKLVLEMLPKDPASAISFDVTLERPLQLLIAIYQRWGKSELAREWIEKLKVLRGRAPEPIPYE